MATPSVDISWVSPGPDPHPRPNRLWSPWILWPFCGAALFGITWLVALGVKALAASPSYAARLPVVGGALEDIAWKEIFETAAACLCLILGFAFPRLASKTFHRLDGAITRFANHKTQAILLAGLLPLIVRLALLPALGPPEPLVADEFGYLLLADTFASGRLTNPTHAMWRHFETIYVFHQPTYTSIYPIAPALLLTIPKLLGAHPWLGVCFGAGLMCALICWMLQAWVPPKWALLGGLLAVCRFTVTSPWMNSYWGGAAAAIGGTLVLGALPRIMKHRRRKDSLLFGLGLAVLAQSRPYEGVLLAAPLLIALAVWFFRDPRSTLRVRMRNVALPLAVAMLALVVGTFIYNSRVTGKPLVMPYALHQKLYGTPQPFFWQAPIRDAPRVHGFQDVAAVFRWQLKAFDDGFTWLGEGRRVQAFWRFYLQPLLTVPFLFLPLIIRDRKMRLLLLTGALMLTGNSLYAFFFPHYAAPMCGLLLVLMVQGMRHLRAFRLGSRRAGLVAFRMLIVMIAATTLATVVGGLLQPWHVTAASTPRGRALQQLKERGGLHLVLVRYSRYHSFHYGVVFNDANIDRSPVVWARELDPASNKALLTYYKNREVWLFNPDQEPVTLVPYTEKAYLTTIAGGTGKRDDVRDGVSPGSIAVLLGGNFAGGLQGTANPHSLAPLPVRLASASAEFGDVYAPEPESEEAGETGPLPLKSGSVSVHFGSTPAPILSVSHIDGQESITVQVPFELPAGWSTVTLRSRDDVAVRKVRILPATPGIFQMRMADARIRAILLRPDGSMVDLDNRARRGEVLRLFSTGLGPMIPVVRTNERGVFPPVSEPIYRLIIGVNHQGVPLVYARYAAEMTGVEEIAFKIPDTVPAGSDIPLSVGVVVDGKTVYSNKSSLPLD